MSIISARDIADAVTSGRMHSQRFLKNAGSTGDGHWQDWSFASGQPAYDARIGSALTFTPFVSTGNDAIFFPSISPSESRHLLTLRTYTTASGNDQTSVDFIMYDLLGVYPLIDGDSTDLQSMDNASPLPRYSDGVGVRAILVNHVSPAATAGCQVNINYVDSNDQSRSMSAYTSTFGAGKACASLQTTGASTGLLYLPSDGPGVKRITDVTFVTPPSGLWAVYLVRPINQGMSNQGGLGGVNRTVFTEKCIAATESFFLPRIYDGACLGFFYLPTGGGRTVSIFGTATFIWK